MENIIITKSHQTVASLAELAAQINAEHGQVETAVRDGLEHARQASVLLLQVKVRVPYGSWLPWLEANCQATPRMAQRYMKIAENWDEVVARGGKGHGLKGALKLLTRTEDPKEPNTTPVSYLPPALAYYQQNGLINDDAAAQLLGLEQDYGPEILTKLRFNPPREEIRDACWFHNMLRPLEIPLPWPIIVRDEEPAGLALTAAMKIFFDDGYARGGKVPQWEVASYWFGSAMMLVTAKCPEFVAEKGFSSLLSYYLKVWRESFRTALVFVGWMGLEAIEGDDAKRIYWAYQADLRHAGVGEEALEIKDNPNAHPSLSNSLMAGFDEIEQHGCNYLLPSVLQGPFANLTGKDPVPRHVEPPTADGLH